MLAGYRFRIKLPDIPVFNAGDNNRDKDSDDHNDNPDELNPRHRQLFGAKPAKHINNRSHHDLAENRQNNGLNRPNFGK